MILEGFEIENWSCLKKVSVSGLPKSGVVVIHAPNRTGKSSIVQALRACLMDFPSSSKSSEVTSRFPRGSGEKPVVTVTFRCGGTTYRIQKHFGTGKSELASKTATGAWKVETTSVTDAHERTCGLVGGSDSSKGLQQLLWLTQAEFRLPDAKKFDPSVQSQLRGILGVLQTPLDDRFIEQVKNRWNVWHSGQRKAGKHTALKDGCKLAENLRQLDKVKQELAECERRFQEIEGLLRQSADLEQANSELGRLLESQKKDLQSCREEHQQCQQRIMKRQQAEKDHVAAEREQAAAVEEQRQRTEVAGRLELDEAAIQPAEEATKNAAERIEALQKRQEEQRGRLSTLREERRQLQEQTTQTVARLSQLAENERLSAIQTVLLRAEETASQIAELEASLAEKPVPDAKQLTSLKENRQKAERLQAQCDAVAMQMSIVSETGALPARLAVDGQPQRAVPAGTTAAVSVRRKAELAIEGWGRVEIRRGTDGSNIDEIEGELRQLSEEFAGAVSEFGIAGSDPKALDQILERAADCREKKSAVEIHKRELKKIAPSGLEALRADVRGLQAKLTVVAAGPSGETMDLPPQPRELEQLKNELQQRLGDTDRSITNLETGGFTLETELATVRAKEISVREALATCHARAKASREELGRLRSAQQIVERAQQAQSALITAQTRLKEAELTPRELTIDERLQAAEGAVRATEMQLRDCSEKFHVIKGRLMDSEGLHATRSSLAARVDELTRVTDRESLQRAAIDRLYELFEECREKQLGTLMGPIHDRVLSWMRVLEIGDYQELRFNDAFLPDKLLSRDGTAEFQVHEESTGAQEQIGMLVRLALGSILATGNEPTVAILDDPLTHCDSGRLNKMRHILRRAAEGDGNHQPPAGPLQILVFTCHPEWFRDERATVIDLQNPEIMTRWAC